MRICLALAFSLIFQNIWAVTQAQIEYIAKDTTRAVYLFDADGDLVKIGLVPYVIEEEEIRFSLYHYAYARIDPSGRDEVIVIWEGRAFLREPILKFETRLRLTKTSSGDYALTYNRESMSRGFQFAIFDKTGSVRLISAMRLGRRWEHYQAIEGDARLHIVSGEVTFSQYSDYLSYWVVTPDTLIRIASWSTKEICGRKGLWSRFFSCLRTEKDNILISAVVSEKDKEAVFFLINPEGRVLRRSKILKLDAVAIRKYPDVLFRNGEMVQLADGRIAAYVPIIEGRKTFVYEVHLTQGGEVIKSDTCKAVTARDIRSLPEGHWARVDIYRFFYRDKDTDGIIDGVAIDDYGSVGFVVKWVYRFTIYGFDREGNLYYYQGEKERW